MSASPESTRAEDLVVALISSWLARRLDNDELRRGLEEIGRERLGVSQAEAVAELLEELARARPGERGDVEMVARETLEAVALG
jgi:hypothetical protein